MVPPDMIEAPPGSIIELYWLEAPIIDRSRFAACCSLLMLELIRL